MRPRYVRQVERKHVGQRVSVRYLIDDPERGRIPTDVIGRLGAFDDEALLIIDRHSQLHTIGAQAVVSSRLIPPHPRRPAEPNVGTEERPLYRFAARVVVLDADQRVLLVSHRTQPDRPPVWTAPGGGVTPGEPPAEAARRELVEELDLDADIGPCVWKRRVVFSYRGLWLDQDEQWFLAQTDLSTTGLTALADVPRDADTVDARFFRVDELTNADIEVAPAALADHLATLLRDGPPAQPIDVGR